MTTTLMIVHAWMQMTGLTEEEAAEQIKELLIYGQKENAPVGRDAANNDLTTF